LAAQDWTFAPRLSKKFIPPIWEVRVGDKVQRLFGLLKIFGQSPESLPKHCKKKLKTSLPSSPPPSEREGQGGGEKAPKVRSCDRRKNPYGPLNARVKTIFRRNLLHLLSYVRYLAMKGVHIRPLQQLLGHKTLTITQRYSHLAPEQLRNAIKLLEGIIGEKGDLIGQESSWFRLGVSFAPVSSSFSENHLIPFLTAEKQRRYGGTQHLLDNLILDFLSEILSPLNSPELKIGFPLAMNFPSGS
jgi:hypothetical protein